MTESQSADAEPPPPPKPDLSRYTGLRTHLTLATNEGKKSMPGRQRTQSAVYLYSDLPSKEWSMTSTS